YSTQLLGQGRGFPLYRPEPRINLPVRYRREGVSIGDVGRVTTEGDFDFFFNIYLPKNDPINANVPEGFVPLSPYDPIDVGHCDFDSGNFVAGPSIHEINGDFQSRSYIRPNGAVLALPHGAHLKKLENLTRVRQYAVKNAESWYKYVNETRGRGLVNGSLYLITGCEKAESWGMASYHDVPLQNEFPISFGPTADADGGYRYRWQGTHFRHKHADSPPLDDTPLNQTTFIHAFAISLSEGLLGLRKGVEISQLVDSPPTAGKSGGGFVPFGSQSSSLWWSFSIFGGGAPSGGRQCAGRALVHQNGMISDAAPIPKVRRHKINGTLI
ncbi:hypothetical protein B0H19DRAFT_923299, partial [Mycena capillaripes]